MTEPGEEEKNESNATPSVSIYGNELLELSEQQLAERFRPYFYFDSKEKYLPMSMESVLENSRLLYQGEELVPQGKLNGFNLNTFNNVPNPNMLAIDTDKSVWGGSKYAPLYARVRARESMITINYILNYAYNGSSYVFGLIPAGKHQGDIEHVTLQISVFTGEILRMFFSHHGSGYWVCGKDLQMSPDGHGHLHPCVYVARSAHAMYHRPGHYARFAVFVWEHADGKGFEWSNSEVQLVNDKPWLGYAGRMGAPANGRMMHLHSWWHEEQEHSLKWLHRVLLSC